jgi:hypothetical protein
MHYNSKGWNVKEQWCTLCTANTTTHTNYEKESTLLSFYH